MLKNKRKIEIEMKAIELLQSAEMLDMIPVKIIKLANTLDLKVYKSTFEKQNISGAIVKNTEKDEYNIYIKKDDAQVRQRFTVAHEIGHYLLHKEKLEDEHYDDIMYRGNMSNEEEEEANYFAGCLLMNKEPLLKIYRLLKDKKELARMFEVSEAAMSIRIGEILK